jgi:hypothetical protein
MSHYRVCCDAHKHYSLFAKKMMAHIHKTDKLDAKGLATLEHLGSLPTVADRTG